MDLDGDLVLLEEEFSLYPNRNLLKATLTKTKIIVEEQDKLIDVIDLNDVIGCHILQTRKKTSPTSFFCIFSYPLKKKKFGSGWLRQRQTKTFAVNCKNSYEENVALTEVWKMAIKRLIRGDNINSRRDLESGSLPARNLLVLVNPFSGRRKALTMYKEKVRPMFAEAEIKHTVIKTEYSGHAVKIAKEVKLNDWDGIVIVSGDGLIHEVINGLMDREDWKEAINTPIGVVPGGSGNALAASIVYASTGLYNAFSASFCLFEICRGAVSRLDLVGVEQTAIKNPYTGSATDEDNNDRRPEVYSFLTTVIGLISDIDIESEKIRFIGQMRINIFAIWRILRLRRYRLELSYLPLDESSTDLEETDISRQSSLPPLDGDLPDGWTVEKGRYVQVLASYISHIGEGLVVHNPSRLCDGKIYLHKLDETTTRSSIMKIWDLFEKGLGLSEFENKDIKKSIKQEDIPGVTVSCTAFRLVPKSRYSEIIAVDGERIPYRALQCRILPGLARVMTSRANF